MKGVLVFIFSMVVTQINAMESTPYAGQQTRMIKALSMSEIEGLKRGKGMGLAKAAELNHYPGPLHVLEEAEKLSLTKIQISKTKKLFASMKKEAITAGNKIIASEQALDEMFAKGIVTAVTLQKKLNEIGQHRAKLRFVHLKTHLLQKTILSSQQIKHYDMLRGYNDMSGKHHNHHGHH